MKFVCTFKTPDALFYALRDIEDEGEREEAGAFAAQWVDYGEYVYIEFDTEAGTAAVVKRR